MRADDAWIEHLVKPYGAERLRSWVARLHRFRVVRAEPSPFGVEGDSIQLSLAEPLPDAVRSELAADPDADLVDVVVAGSGARLVIRGAARRRPVLTDADVALAERLEAWLDEAGVATVDPPAAGRGCLWPGAYPDWFSG